MRRAPGHHRQALGFERRQPNRRRLDDPSDFVRIEIEAALQRNVPVIPVLVDGAAMPRAGELPDSLKKLTRRQAVEISHTRFDSDAERLTEALSQLEDELRQRDAAKAEPTARTADAEAASRAGEQRRAPEARARRQRLGRPRLQPARSLAGPSLEAPLPASSRAGQGAFTRFLAILGLALSAGRACSRANGIAQEKTAPSTATRLGSGQSAGGAPAVASALKAGLSRTNGLPAMSSRPNSTRNTLRAITPI